MKPAYAPRVRPERLIGAGRLVLAVSSLFAIWLDPSEPAKYAGVAYGLLIAYVVYATVVAALVWEAEALQNRWQVVSHAFDLTFFSLFIYFTEGTASPFTAYFVFALVCATLRWQWRGTLWTALVSLTAFLGLGFYFSGFLRDPAFDVHGFVIRSVYLMVIAVLLAYLGAHEQQTRHEMSLLAGWPQVFQKDIEPLTRELLGYASQILTAPRVLLAWTEQEEPWMRVGLWSSRPSEWVWAKAGPHPVVAEPLSDHGFICADASAPRARVRRHSSTGPDTWQGPPIDTGFADQYGIRSVVSLPLRGQTVEGHLFFLDKPRTTSDDLILGEIVAGMLASRLDQFYLMRELQQGAAVDERMRLARDLHDGVLQSFTGVALRLAAVQRLLVREPQAAMEALEEAQRLMAAEQRDLRFFIHDLEPTTDTGWEADAVIRRLGDLAQRIEREWEVHVELRVLELPELAGAATVNLGREIYHIAREAVVNAVRHGQASAVRVEVRRDGASRLAISVTDNGRGFPFEGDYSAEDLTRLNIGPRTLRERVQGLRGTLMLHSNGSGARIDVVLPLVES